MVIILSVLRRQNKKKMVGKHVHSSCKVKTKATLTWLNFICVQAIAAKHGAEGTEDYIAKATACQEHYFNYVLLIYMFGVVSFYGADDTHSKMAAEISRNLVAR